MKKKATANISSSSSALFRNLGGSCSGTPAIIYWGNALFAFVQNADHSLGLCAINSVGAATWSTIPCALKSSPAVAASPNGRIAVIALMENQQIAISYVQPFQGSHSSFAAIGGELPPGIIFTPSLMLTANADQRLWAFVADIKGTLWHTFQLQPGATINWSNWSIVDENFTTIAKFNVFLNTSTWCLQVVALGRDNLMYQAIQSAGEDRWSKFQVVGTGNPQFVNGLSTCMSASGNPCYAGYNADMRCLGAFLLFCSPSDAAWTALTISQQDQPLATNVPVLIDNNGTPQILFQNIPGQVLFISQSIMGTGFWEEVQTIGVANPNFTGNLSAVANLGKVAICSPSIDGNLYFINWDPGTPQSGFTYQLSRLVQKMPAPLKQLIHHIM